MAEMKELTGSIEEKTILEFLKKCDERTLEYNEIQNRINDGSPDKEAMQRFIDRVDKADFDGISYYIRALALNGMMALMYDSYSREDQEALSNYTEQVGNAGEKMKEYLETVQKELEKLN